MAATTKISQLRPKSLPVTTTHNPTSIHFFSSSSSFTTPDSNSNPSPPPEPPPPSPSPSPSPSSAFFGSIKARLRQPQQQQQQRNPQSPKPSSKPYSFGFSNPNQPTRPHNNSLENIKKNLAEYRRRTAPPPPPSSNAFGSNAAPPSLGEIFERNVTSKGGGPTTGDAPKMTFKDIQKSLRILIPTPDVNRNGKSDGLNEYRSSPNIGRSLKLGPATNPSPSVIGGSHSTLPSSVFGPELSVDENGDSSDGSMRTKFVKMYEHKELGEKLRLLRPEKKLDKKDWFSLEELNQRLAKLREMEKRGVESRLFGSLAHDVLRDSISKLEKDDEDKAKQKMNFRFDSLILRGRTPFYMLSSPKEDLVEKYFNPDNMSASEKLKIELNKVRDEFKMSESDCGSARVQVAQLTTKIKHLSEVLHPKDKHSKKGLRAMVEKRKKLLKYMRRTDWDSYCFVLSKLGLRDNPGYKQ